MNIAPRHLRKHQAYLKRTREHLEAVRRFNQSLNDKCRAWDAEETGEELTISCQPTVVLPEPPACIEPLAAAHECLCTAKCEYCVRVPPHAAAEEELLNNAEVEKVLSDGNAKEHLAAAKVCDCSTPCRVCKCASAGIPVRLSFWQRFKLWFAELIAPLCSYREGGVNYRPPVKQE